MPGKTFASFALAATVSITGVAAIWAPMTMAQLVDNSELILTGELVSIDESQSDTASASGTLRVEDVLRAPSAEPKPSSVQLSLPSRTRRMASDAVMYKEGQRGIWFLRRDATGALVADNPQRLKPLSELTAVRAFLAGSAPR